MWEIGFVASKPATYLNSAPRVPARPSLPSALYGNHPQKEINRLRYTEKGPRKKSKAAVLCLSFLCAATILVGNFDGSNFSEASERVKEDASVWTPNFSSSSSDQLLKSLSANQNNNVKSTTQSPKYKQRYWDAIASGNSDDIKFVNEKLVDNAVSTISTMYYDSSGGFNFDPQQFYAQWKASRSSSKEKKDISGFPALGENPFGSRDNAISSLKSIVASLNDPYSNYLTRDELRKELTAGDGSFLGLGALVETPSLESMSQLPSVSIPQKEKTDMLLDKVSKRNRNGQYDGLHRSIPNDNSKFRANKKINEEQLLSVAQAENLPVVTAIVPDSPAERAGIVVGDRITSVGEYQFTGMSRTQVKKALEQKFHAENYFGVADLTIAKRIMAGSTPTMNVNYGTDGNVEEKYVFEDGWYRPRRPSSVFDDMQVIGYKTSRVKSIPTTLTAGSSLKPDSSMTLSQVESTKYPTVFGGDNIVHYELLTPDDSIFQQFKPDSPSAKVGYIRLTRFSRASTAGYIEAVKELEKAGAQSYIIDLRNNYGGVIQEAMLTASTLLRDPHVVLCYTLNSRGGFKPQENMEYIVDKAYPGYLLSSEASTVSRDQVKREHPEYLEDGGWTSPTSYASLKELRMTRGIKPAVRMITNNGGDGFQPASSDLQKKKEMNVEELANAMSRNSQKKLILLINEGTGKQKWFDLLLFVFGDITDHLLSSHQMIASSAEVFASALHDNGRTVALVGTKTFGKGVIQHTFPMPDGGGLRLTVAEYLTPSLHHVSKVGNLKYDSGIRPDVYCESKQGIPKNVGADLCVGVALDVLEGTDS